MKSRFLIDLTIKNAEHTARCKAYAGSVGLKQLPALFKLSGVWTTNQHDFRTGLTAQRYVQAVSHPR